VHTPIWVLALGAAAVAAAAGDAAVPWEKVFSTRAPAAQQLRGYGRVGTEIIGYRSAGRRVWALTFHCEGPQQASTLVGKFLADLGLSPRVKASAIAVAGLKVPIRATDGGVFAACADGAVARVLCGGSEAAMAAFIESHPAMAARAVASAAYPMFLDRFDRWGWGCYGLDGFSGGDWENHVKQPANDDGPRTPVEDLSWLAKNGFRFEPWLDLAILDNSDGLVKNTETDWKVRKARELGLAVSFRVYAVAGGCDWTARRFPEYMEQPASFLMSGWHGGNPFWKASPHLTWYDPDIHRYLAARTMDMMRPYAGVPNVTGWMHPHGELVHNAWYDLHDDYSPAARRNWRDTLRKQGLTLEELSRMYGRTTRPFHDWDQVTVPEYATFAGLGGEVLSLAGDWWHRGENPGGFNPDQAWWGKPLEQRYAGLREKWWQGEADTQAWGRIHAPGGFALCSLLFRNSPAATTWFRRSFELTPEQLAKAPVYLYWFPVSHDGIHSGPHARFHEVFLNGQKAGEIGSWGALDVTKRLVPGENQIALHLHGPMWDGRIFLSAEPPQVYPYLGKDRNRLWVLWRNWHADVKYLAWREILDGMRQVDPDRPIKFMAPIAMGEDRWLDLAARYGAFGHFTGEGMWFFPWYKRYGFLYDVPGSSEPGGPPNPQNAVADQFDCLRRTFLTGLNAHDPVFVAQWYTRHPALRAWWVAHNPVLKQMGRYDLDGPQVLLYRSSILTRGLVGCKPHPRLGETTREIQSPWNWDIGLGTLQTIGQSYLYLDDGGLADGKMTGYRVMFDCSNESMSPAAVEQIAAWVRGGGTFVALPFSGRNTLDEADAWPIRTLTGCEVARLRPVGKGTVTVKKGQSVLKAFAGKTHLDKGRSVDWVGGNHNLYSVELKPGAHGEVLATYENGAAAIVKRTLGRGAVITLGTAFWRDSADRQGIWWPEPLETEFVADLLAGLGYPQAPCATDDRLVWPQPYRSNNGLDLVAVLVSWHDDKDVECTLRLRLPRKPAALVSYGVDGIQPLPFEWANGEAVARVRMPAKEVKVVRATGCVAPFDAASHWWTYQQRMWHELAKPAIDFTPYTRGKWADPTLDLSPDARLTSAAPPDAAWTKPGFDDAAWTPCRLGILRFEGPNVGKPLWVRKRFEVPGAWAARGGKTYLVSAAWSGRHYLGAVRLTLNGVLLHDAPGGSYNEFDVTKLLADGENVVGFEFKGGQPVQGFAGNVYLYHRAAPEKSVSLAGVWDATDAAGRPTTLTLPGTGSVNRPTSRVLIPKEWEGRYQVRLTLEGRRESILGAHVNGRLMRRHHHGLGERCDIDITGALRFGTENTLILAPQGEPQAGRTSEWNIRILLLDLFPAIDTRSTPGTQ